MCVFYFLAVFLFLPGSFVCVFMVFLWCFGSGVLGVVYICLYLYCFCVSGYVLRCVFFFFLPGACCLLQHFQAVLVFVVVCYLVLILFCVLVVFGPGSSWCFSSWS